ncbi:hypothetical protein [Brevibacillus choshinensis]|nr:hypothetical protein [Brevibacillus choshinensis]
MNKGISSLPIREVFQERQRRSKLRRLASYERLSKDVISLVVRM